MILDDNYPTIFDRVFKPTEGDLLYHYCSTDTYLAMMSSNCVRMSDINMLNDAHEGLYGYEIFEAAATLLLTEEPRRAGLEDIDVAFFDMVDAYLSPKQFHSHPVIACFSKDPDVLSQWRGYADDGKGWSVGFCAKALSRMPVTLLEVLYDPDRQLLEAANTLAAIYLRNRASENPGGSEFAQDCLFMSSVLLGFKHPSFREEMEVRALHELRVEVTETSLKLTDDGYDDDQMHHARPVHFRSSEGSIIAYIDMPFRTEGEAVVKEVWFGPRNVNGWGNALMPLSSNNHDGVRIKYASSPYRG